MGRKKFETDAGKLFSKETRSISRSLAATQAARTRRKNREGEREQYRSSRYLPESYDTDNFYGIYPVETTTLAEVVDDTVQTMEWMRSEHGVEDDVAIWLGRRLVAVVRFGPDGKPTPTVF
jgi:hypothetical protein